MKKLSVVLLTLVLAAAWTATAFAEAKPYASIRFQTMYTSFEDSVASSADVSDLRFGLLHTGTSRVGVKFKVSDEVSGLVELRLFDSDNSNTVGLRHAFGKYDFGAGTLLIGQTWMPYSVFFPQVYDDTAGLRQGSAANRAAQVRLTLDAGVYIALIDNTAGTTDDDVEIPEIAIGYKGKAGNVGFGIHGAYVSVDDTGADEEGYAVMGDITAKLGGVKLMARAFFGEDVNRLTGGGFALSTGTTSGDLDSYGVIASATFYPSDKIAVTVGGAYNETEASAGDDNNELTLWVNAPIKVTKGFTIVPEIAYVDALDVAGIGGASTTNGADNALFVGAKWQFDL